jgi:flagellar hook-associated protein 3 FlgL
MRISERHRYAVANNRMNTAKNQNTDAMSVLSTQKRLQKVEDDPVGMTKVIRGRHEVKKMESFLENINFSKGFINLSESALQGLQNNLQRARELAVGMANDTYAIDSRRSVAREVKEVINEVVNLGNTQYNGHFVFSGFRNRTPAFSHDGTFLGDDGAIYMEVADGNFRQINLQGRAVFEATLEDQEKGHFNMIDALNMLKTSLESDDKDGIYKSIEEMQYQIEKTASLQANIGAIWGAIEKAEDRITLQKEQKIQVVSKVEDADMFEATSDFKRTESALQTTLMASNKLLQPSLLNFIQ